MRFKSIASRIIIIFLSLILVVQLSSFFIIRASIDDNAVNLTTSELGSAKQVLSLLLEQNFQKLQQAARLLKSDEALVEAVAAHDEKAIERALSSSTSHAGSDFLVWLDGQGQRSISTRPANAAFEHSIKVQTDKALRGETPVGLGVYKGEVYQFVVEPVKISGGTSWVAVALPVDEKIVTDLHRLTAVEASIMVPDEKGAWASSLSTLPIPSAQAMEREIRKLAPERAGAGAGDVTLRILNEDYNVSVVSLDAGDQRASIVLMRSISDATEPYQKLQLILLTLTSLSIVIAFMGSASAVRRITNPLLHLAKSAERLGQGDYTEVIPVHGSNEVADLSRALENMRSGIAKREQEISRLAYWDALTNLPNRAQFTKLLQDEIALSQKDYRPFCLMMMDLDRFKHVNDIMGHSFGDALLRQAAARIAMQVKDGHVARLGGDEFAVLLTQCTVEESRRVAERILAGLEVPIAIDDQTVDLGASIGIVAFPDHGLDTETLLSHAELAMYEAKRSGNAAMVFNAAFDNASQESLSMLSDLRQAIDNNEFQLFIQPKINLATGEAIGGEALVRWVHPEKGIVTPDQFIPFAEKTGFVRVLTQWVLEQAAMLARQMQQAGVPKKISVNISARDLLDFDLPIRFSRLLAKYGVPASSFCLEITESSIMDDPARSMLTLESLHGMGADLSIDDFGTGYSSLSYLKRLPVDELKIDKNFVINMENDPDDAVIVRSTIDLGHNMALRVVAEGVETAQAWRMLASMGCDHGQGYYMSHAMPAAEFLGWLTHWSSASRLPEAKDAGSRRA